MLEEEVEMELVEVEEREVDEKLVEETLDVLTLELEVEIEELDSSSNIIIHRRSQLFGPGNCKSAV